ncbi:XDH, partial [Symbiodinium sp. KB8]
LEAYFAAVEKWADEQGAVSLEELVEFKDDLAKDLNLRTLEKKRMDNAEAAAKVAEQMPLGEGPQAEEPDPPEEEEEDQDAEEDDLAEGRYAQLDTERDLAMMSRGFDAPVEVEEPPYRKPWLPPQRGSAVESSDGKSMVQPTNFGGSLARLLQPGRRYTHDWARYRNTSTGPW